MLRPSRRTLATGNREHKVDHRPPEPEQQSDRTGEVRNRQVGTLGLPPGIPRDHGFHGELGKRLQPGERSEEHTSELQSQSNLVCRLLLDKKKKQRETL